MSANCSGNGLLDFDEFYAAFGVLVNDDGSINNKVCALSALTLDNFERPLGGPAAGGGALAAGVLGLAAAILPFGGERRSGCLYC